MASGSFPLDPAYDSEGRMLIQAADLIDAVCASIADAVSSGESGGMQIDNAASDGASLVMLHLASRLVRAEVRRETPDEDS